MISAQCKAITRRSLLTRYSSWLLRLLTAAIFVTGTASVAAEQVQEKQAEAVLNSLHQSAADANWDTYFSLYLPDAVFIGTDVNEHWNMAEFQRYARPTDGWTYSLKTRTLVRHGNVIVFDELLDSRSYGVSRGTGTLLLTATGWKVAQYHLSFPIPNELAKEITAKIKSEER
ncbi:nuclear transport factor 2 family protein [uncultured Shewanella sp.]|uniref:nuclear transport factor 2 family protein n=1 Tax=uncultured Shewanella sp. TaxID=173975 RepID=UPI00260B156E|nr:nuclear transport factor 2 family protein [uncultured Shewanella sp.]